LRKKEDHVCMDRREERQEDLLCIDNFTLLRKAGEGDGGVVWQAIRKTDGLPCAVKILKAQSEDKPNEIISLEILSNPGHANIVKCFGWGKMFKRTHEKYCCFDGAVGIFLVMEWIKGITLKAKITESTFGKNKRRHVFKQLVEALVYMHSKQVTHGNLYLDNILISIPNKATSCQPHLTVCDFGAATVVPAGHSIKGETPMDKDRCQCGVLLFALFSSINLSYLLVKSSILQKEAFQLAKDLIDARKPVSLEAALVDPFLTNGTCEDRFSSYITVWNDEIVENIATHLILTGDAQDFANASLVCQQFYVTMQRRFIWYISLSNYFFTLL
jgi:serine/threonine protein kinase